MQIETSYPAVAYPFAQAQPRSIVFVVDNDRSARSHLETLLADDEYDMHFFDDAGLFLNQAQFFSPGSRPACLIVDMGCVDGIDLQAWIGAHRELPAIFTAKQACVRTAVRAMKAGGFEFLAKPFDGQLLRNVVAQALQQSRAALMQQAEVKQLHDRFDLLSHREREVMRLVVAGRLNKQAASELGIAEITVKTHRGKVMRKMRANSLPDLVIMAAALHEKIGHIGTASLETTAQATWNA